MRRRTKTIVVALGVAVLIGAGWFGVGFAGKLARWRHLDANYEETF